MNKFDILQQTIGCNGAIASQGLMCENNLFGMRWKAKEDKESITLSKLHCNANYATFLAVEKYYWEVMFSSTTVTKSVQAKDL